MQINLTGFLNGKNARVFMADLWEHLVSAQENEFGVPAAFVDAKKAELQAQKVRFVWWLPLLLMKYSS
jgi:serine/arginine repetitive matrix protein 1